MDDYVDEKTFDLAMDEQETTAHPRVKKSVGKKRTNAFKYLSIAGELGFDIALPMTLGFIVGTKLDERWGTQPKATIGLFLFGVCIACTSLIHIVREVSRRA